MKKELHEKRTVKSNEKKHYIKKVQINLMRNNKVHEKGTATSGEKNKVHGQDTAKSDENNIT